MLRKLSLVAVAAVALGAAALAPTSASARDGRHHGYHGHHGARHHNHWHGPRFHFHNSYARGGCYVRRLVATPWGPRWRLVNRCY